MYGILRAFAAALAIVLATGGSAAAQQATWLQIEAHPERATALQAARRYAGRIEDVAGFRLGATGWYAVAIGPFGSGAEARRARQELRNRSAIPGDSFVTDDGNFGPRFWPEAATATATPAPAAETAQVAPAEGAATPAPAPAPAQPTETRAEALAAERQLDEAQRKLIQIALQWDGHYDAAIDGDFGSGTRAAMEAWQTAQNLDVTGVLTSAQRAALLASYNALLEGLGLETVTDETAGIQITLPTALVAFDRYVPPFAHYEPREGDAPHKVILISQRGDRSTLYGLYDIMQTLEIVPEDGPRDRRERDFTLVGQGDTFISQTEVSLRDGQVKGFTLIWPTGDERRRTRVLNEMRSSFTPLAGKVLDDLDGTPGEDQSIDLLAGLEIRRPALSRSGFFVTGDGAVLTSAQTVGNCERITLNDDITASIAAQDDDSGLALLRPEPQLAPPAVAGLRTGAPLLQSDVVLSGFSFGGALGAPTLTFGKIADLRGLNGEDTLRRLELASRPDDAGGAVLDEAGGVLGLMMPRDADSDRALPATTSFAVNADTIAAFLRDVGAQPALSEKTARLPQAEMTRLAADVTVLVNCWQ